MEQPRSWKHSQALGAIAAANAESAMGYPRSLKRSGPSSRFWTFVCVAASLCVAVLEPAAVWSVVSQGVRLGLQWLLTATILAVGLLFVRRVWGAIHQAVVGMICPWCDAPSLICERIVSFGPRYYHCDGCSGHFRRSPLGGWQIDDGKHARPRRSSSSSISARPPDPDDLAAQAIPDGKLGALANQLKERRERSRQVEVEAARAVASGVESSGGPPVGGSSARFPEVDG